MKPFGLILVLLICLYQVQAQENYRTFIPKGYDTLYSGFAKGDLDKDGNEDLVLALGHKDERSDTVDIDSIPGRILLVLMGTKSGYRILAKTTKAILCKNCGGVFGDPFAGIDIQNGILVMHHYGGSAWRWSYNQKFRYQKKNLYLIGTTRFTYWNVEHCDELGEFAGTDYEDVNLVTGNFEKKVITTDCKLKENRKGKRKVLPLQTITEFSIDN